jgi:DNA-binding CsgD family transcriptional regulator
VPVERALWDWRCVVTIGCVDRLLEREAELEKLTFWAERVGGGRGAVAMVRGDAGIGKTSLLRAVRDRAGLPFYVGRCEPLSVPEPLGPLRELVAAVDAPGALESVAGDRRSFARFLQAVLTSRGPAIAALEDVHWADPATLDVVRVLARRAEDCPLGLVVTFRDDELAANLPLAVLVGDLATDPEIVRISLRGLSEHAVRVLAGDRGADVGAVVRLTAGNPFLVVEMLAAGDALPVSVRDATLARVARLGPEVKGVVDVAAVVGQRVPPDLLDELAPGYEVAVEAALARGVLTDDGTAFGFRHELTRQAIEQAISAPRRAALHGAVARALAARGDCDHARIAHHAEAAGFGELASRHAVLAAGEAERVGALFEAGLQLERALRLGTELTAQLRIDLLIRYARNMNFAGRRLQEALVAAEQAVVLADAASDRAAGGRARSVLSAALWSLDRLEEARTAAVDAVSLLEGTGDAEALARAHAAFVRIEAVAFDPAKAIEHGPAALAAAAAAGLDEARVDALISVALAHGHRGDRNAIARLEAARIEARRAGTAIQVIRAHVNAVSVAGDARGAEYADRVVSDALQLFADFDTAIPRQYLLVVHARTLLDRGRYTDALARVEEGRGDWHGGLVIADAIEALVHARRGEGEPREQLEAALAQLDTVPPGWRHLFLRAALAEVAWLDGDLARGREHARAGLAAPFAAQLCRPAGDALLWAARCGDAATWGAGAVPLPEPVRLELAGDWRAAITAWSADDAPYEAALAALPGDELAARTAIATLKRLGASAAARAFAREREARGGTALRGPRASTLANVAGLTRREQEVLSVLAGGATNPEIAAVLHLSDRTVAHHVSAILSKLGAPTRTAAVSTAREAGLLGGQDGPLGGPT